MMKVGTCKANTVRLTCLCRFKHVAIAVTSAALTVGISHGLSQSALSPLLLKVTIPLPNARGRLDHLAVDLQGQRIFLSEIGNGAVEAISLVTNKSLYTITGLGEPQGLYFDAAANRLFVASGDDGTVKVFDGSSYALVATANLSSDADNLRWDPRSNRVLVGFGGEKFVGGKAVAPHGERGVGDGALAYVDIKGDKGQEIAVDAHPESFQIDRNGTLAFVNVPDRHEIQVANLTKGDVIARWPVSCTDNFPMALDEGHHRLFVGCRIPAKMIAFDAYTGKSVASLEIPGTTDDLFYDSARGRIYVLGGEGAIDVIGQKTANEYGRVARVPVPVGSRTGLFVPELNELFVSVSQSAKHSAELLVFNIN